MGIAVPFPTTQPPGYEWLDPEPRFDPDRHLQLEKPVRAAMLSDLGYQWEQTRSKATQAAASEPFRVLSDEGSEILLDITRRLRPLAKRAGERIENVIRGGVYRSRWLRDLCISQELCTHLESFYEIPIAPHPMPLHLGHINYEPAKINDAIDKWHNDTLPLDIVLMVTDPQQVDGGRFEYFVGTKQQAAELANQGLTPPPERVVAPDFPGPGYAIALHGDMVVHRAGPLFSPGERISMVNGYVALDPSVDEQSRSADLIAVDDPNILYTEWAKMAAWRSSSRLKSLVDDLPFTADRELVIAALETAVEDTNRAIAEMRSGERDILHFGG